jgi:LPXTG-motif cell wall-anchored protein
VAQTPSIPRATEVQGVQVVQSDDPATLARTGVDTVDLAVVGVGLLGLGTLLVKRSSPLRAR